MICVHAILHIFIFNYLDFFYQLMSLANYLIACVGEDVLTLQKIVSFHNLQSGMEETLPQLSGRLLYLNFVVRMVINLYLYLTHLCSTSKMCDPM